MTEPSGRDPNTLMSLPKPEAPDETSLSGRVRELEERVDAVELGLKTLEARRDPLAPGRTTPWWLWLLFLLGLAVTWRLLAMLK